MSWISPIEMNMDISRTVLEGKWDNCLFEIVQKVALYVVIPFMLIVAFEAILKNMIFINAINLAIALLNAGYSLYQYIFATS